jgi:tripartite-type tricarboxylate transporter receptor subunit TctC
VKKLLTGLLLAAATLTSPLQAQEWPPRLVTIVVPFAAGGTTDMFARILGQSLQTKTGAAVVVENKAGAGGNIGTAQVLYKNIAHDTQADFQPVSLIARLPNLLVVSPKIPVKTVAELVDYLKQNPGKLSYGSSGAGTSTHLASELFQMMTGTKMNHLPFRSSGDVMNALAGGHVDLAFDNMTLAWPQAQAGTVRALAVTSKERSPTAPDVPTLAESLPGFEATSWHGLFVPAGTPRPIVDRLASEVRTVFDNPDQKKKLTDIGAVAAPMSPEQFVEFIAAERKKWQDVVKASGASIQ